MLFPRPGDVGFIAEPAIEPERLLGVVAGDHQFATAVRGDAEHRQRRGRLGLVAEPVRHLERTAAVAAASSIRPSANSPRAHVEQEPRAPGLGRGGSFAQQLARVRHGGLRFPPRQPARPPPSPRAPTAARVSAAGTPAATAAGRSSPARAGNCPTACRDPRASRVRQARPGVDSPLGRQALFKVRDTFSVVLQHAESPVDEECFRRETVLRRFQP
jgi:hypothetical protein